ncbi:MAG: hypothetical protein COB22_07365 [Cycloclasticus sp.]|nr:MAG: hypothetical protein COB22_07365 [Cycloclasticus sp.]
MSQNAAGQLTEVKLGNGITTQYNYDAQTNLIESIRSATAGGNGYDDIQNLGFEFDAIGNLTKRIDYNQWIDLAQLEETFNYDNLNRMVSSAVYDQAAKTYSYDTLGNITSKTGVGSYTYAQNAGPHAVTSVDNNGTISNYAYDANGSMISGAGRNIVYNSFNKPTQLSNASADIRFSYGADRSRVTRQNTVTGELRHYVGSLFERKVLAGLTTYTHYIKAAGSTVAIVNSKSDGSNTTHYLHKDHLGSIATISDAQGLVVESQSYDAHGKRRNADWSDISGNPAPSTSTDRGFTGHEHIDEVGLIHMNGRVYDATLGRFISADPNIQAPYNAQNFNRYTYVLNNPLSYTDPSGFFFSGLKKAFKSIFKGIKNFFKSILQNEILRTVISIAIAIYGIPGLIDAGAIFSKGFAAGFVGSGGDLKAGLVAGITAGAFKGIGDYAENIVKATGKALSTTAQVVKTLAHGVVGGVASVANGGEFKHGFLATGTAQAFASEISGLDKGNAGFSAQRTVAAAAVGGFAAELGGGKFANGAITGAFSRAFNDEIHISINAEVSSWVSDAYEYVTGDPLISNGGSFGLYVSAPNINNAGEVISGEWDAGYTLSANIMPESIGVGALRIAEFGWSTASSAYEIAGIGAEGSFQYGSFGGSVNLNRIGFDISLLGTGYHAGGSGTLTSVGSLKHGFISFENNK